MDYTVDHYWYVSKTCDLVEDPQIEAFCQVSMAKAFVDMPMHLYLV